MNEIYIPIDNAFNDKVSIDTRFCDGKIMIL